MAININLNGEAIKEARKLLEYPPYLIFVFIGLIFVFVSLIWDNNFYQVWIFLLYAVFGSIWRYIEKDMMSGIQKLIKEEKNMNIANLSVISIYHIGNLVLLFALFKFLKLA